MLTDALEGTTIAVPTVMLPTQETLQTEQSFSLSRERKFERAPSESTVEEQGNEAIEADAAASAS